MMDQWCKLCPDRLLASLFKFNLSDLQKLMDSYFLFIFIAHPCMALCIQYASFAHISAMSYQVLVKLSVSFTLCIYSTGLAIYRLKFLHIPTLEGTLHG